MTPFVPDHDTTASAGDLLDKASRFGWIATLITSVGVLWRGAKWIMAVGQMRADIDAFKVDIARDISAMRVSNDRAHEAADAWRADAMERIIRTEAIVDSRQRRRDPA